jgi:hypothetical protein
MLSPYGKFSLQSGGWCLIRAEAEANRRQSSQRIAGAAQDLLNHFVLAPFYKFK